MATEIRGCVDCPQPNSAFALWLTVSGWAFAKPAADIRVRIRVESALIRDLSPSLARPDVRDHFQDFAIPEMCGFETTIHSNELPNQDNLVLSVEACVSPQDSRPLGEIPVRRLGRDVPTVQRGDYAVVWDNVSQTIEHARLAACGSAGLNEFDETGEQTSQTVIGLLAISSQDVVLEIGCGPGRVGKKIAPGCRHWIGADVSGKMLEHARQTLLSLPNVSFHQLSGYDLRGIQDGSIDAAYCTGVFMHLDEWDRYRYVTEMYRVLRSGGRGYIDNVNLLGEEGWRFFLRHCLIEPANRPPNISKMSTPDELQTYFEKSGFIDLRLISGSNWIIVAGRKP